MNNSKVKDNGARAVLENPKLCLQLLQDYLGLDIFDNVRAEDIEDVTDRFLPMFTEERDADVIKRIKLSNMQSDEDMVYVVSLIEHKSYVEHNVVMQLLRYMVFIWEDYEKEQNRIHPGISSQKNFKYPPIIPIVYYEGKNKWTAIRNLKERIACNDIFGKFIPDYGYHLVSLNEYSNDELISKNNELSLVMLINKIQEAKEFKELNLPTDYLDNISKKSTQDILSTLSKIIAAIMGRFNMEQQEIDDFTSLVKERKMGQLFENFTGAFDIQEARAKARKEGRAEGQLYILITQVCRKMAKGKNVSEIAEDLDENLGEINVIYEEAFKHAPNYDVEEILANILAKRTGNKL